jgi:hypothetical protein
MEKIYVLSEKTKDFLFKNKGVYFLTDQLDVTTEKIAMAVYPEPNAEQRIFAVKIKEINFERPIEIGYHLPSSGIATSENWIDESKSPIEDATLYYPTELNNYTDCSGFELTKKWIEATTQNLTNIGTKIELNKLTIFHLFALESVKGEKSQDWLRSRMRLSVGF